MPLGRLIFLSSLVLTVAALSPAAAPGAAKGTDRPLSGKGTSTTTANVVTGTGTSDGTFRVTHLGKATVHGDATSGTLTGPNTFTAAGTGTIMAANGDKLFSTFTLTGTFTSTTVETTSVSTITGGTGRFAEASGTIMVTTRSVIIAIVGSTITTRDIITSKGQISY